MPCRNHPGCTHEHCQGYIPLRECLHNLKLEAYVPNFAQQYSSEELISMYARYEADRKKHPVLRWTFDHLPSFGGLNSRDRHDIARKILDQQGQDLSFLETA